MYYETMRLGDVRLKDDRLGDFRLRVFRSEDGETEKTITIRCLLSDVFKSFRLLVS